MQANLATWRTWRRSQLALAQATWLGVHLADSPGVKPTGPTWRNSHLAIYFFTVGLDLGLGIARSGHGHGHVLGLGSVLVSVSVSASISVSSGSRSSIRSRFALGHWFREASLTSQQVPCSTAPLEYCCSCGLPFPWLSPNKKSICFE